MNPANLTGVLEEQLSWSGMLIEASPDHFEKLVRRRADQTCVHAAVCNNDEVLVHWADPSQV